MKVINLLVDIANNGEREKHKYFKYFNRLDKEDDIAMIHLYSIIYKLNNGCIDLNDEIEIIEDTSKETNKIEHIGTNFYFAFDEQVQQDSLTEIAIKINEIIDRLNGEE